MTAFVAFVTSYAIWLYLLCAIGILVGIKLLTDARRLARTTLFSLEQERAGEQTYRAIILVIVLLLAIGAITVVEVFFPQFVPQSENPILRAATPTLAALVFPTSTLIPPPTPTLIRPTETPFVTSTPVTPTPVRPVTTRAPVAATAPPTATSIFALPAPVLRGPNNGMVVTGFGNANTSLTFKWDCFPCPLGPNDRYVISISYTDRNGKAATVGAGPQQNYITMGDIIRGYPTDIYQQAKDDTYYWQVQIKRGDTPLSPPSETWKFIWH